MRHLSSLKAQTPPTVHIERQILPKGDCPFCLQTEGFLWGFFLEEHFLQQTLQPNNSIRQIATGKSQPSSKKSAQASEDQRNDKYLKYHKATGEIVGQRFVIEGRCLQ